MTPTKEQILEEMEAVRADLRTFTEARDVFQRRSAELESDPGRHERFVGWAVTQIVLNGLLLGVVKCEGLLEDYQRALERQELAPVLSLVNNKENLK